MKKNIIVFILCLILFYPIKGFAEIFWSADFEDASTAPAYNFTGKQQDKNMPQCTPEERVFVGGERGWVWRMIFKGANTTPSCDNYQTKSGFHLTPTWPTGNTIHYRYYVRYGDSEHPYSWSTTPFWSYELKFPDIANALPSRVIFKHRTQNFQVYTPYGIRVNRVNYTFQSNVWYCIEVLMQDNGNNDTVKIWVNNNDENNPNYSHSGENLVDFSQFQPNTSGYWYNHLYRNHVPYTDQYFYIDDFAIANEFIGTGSTTGGNNPPPVQTGNTNLPFESDFEEGNWTEWNGGHSSSMSIISDNANSGSYCARAPLTAGTHSDNYLDFYFGDHINYGGDKLEEVYLRVYSKFNSGYVWPNDDHKIALINITDGQTSQRRYQVGILVNNQGQYFVEHTDIDDWRFYDMPQNQGSPVDVRFDVWEKLKLYVKLNTPGNADGILKLWVNDVLKVSYTNVNITENTGYGLNKLILSSYAVDASGSNGFQYFDDWRLSVDDPDGDVALTPPTAPGNLRIEPGS